MTGNGTREDGGPEGANGYDTAQLICTAEGSFIDGGSHAWKPWLSTSAQGAGVGTAVLTAGARYYRAGTAIFVLDSISLTTGADNKLGAPLDGATDNHIWTGTNKLGNVDEDFGNCHDWTSEALGVGGSTGSRDQVNLSWTTGYVYECSFSFPVLCVQQIK